MTNFKFGDRVYLKKYGLVGVLYSIKGDDVKILTENRKIVVVRIGELEKFIEPKYKIGTKIYCYPYSYMDENMDDTCEIVKSSLNKKMGEYSYLAFSETGQAFAFNESQVIKKKKICPRKPVVIEFLKTLKAI